MADRAETTVRFRVDRQVGRVDPRLFGGFVEHLGRVVYGGLYEPESRHADVLGWRTDVLQALDRLRFSCMRYPGGNFVSGYNWRDGIGPVSERPAILDEAWNSLEPNTIGTDEFLSLCGRVGWDPMMAVNLGTGSPEAAAELVAYCNADEGPMAEERSANGRAEPYGVGLWCLGNDMDGDWQIGHVPVDQYAQRALEAATLMRAAAPDIQLVACGSSNMEMATFGEWDRQVLDSMGGAADYISLHRYATNPNGDTDDFLAITNSIDAQIETIDRVCREEFAARGTGQRVFLSFDEWNVWYRTAVKQFSDGDGQVGVPIIEEHYTLEDALVVAGFLNSFIRHADVVHVANLAQVVNAIAPILTIGDELLYQSIYWPFKMVSDRRTGISLHVDVDGPGYRSKTYGKVTYIDASVIHNDGRLSAFLINRRAEDVTVRLNPDDVTLDAVSSAELVSGSSPTSENTLGDPNAVSSQPFRDVRVVRSGADIVMPAHSFLAVTFDCS